MSVPPPDARATSKAGSTKGSATKTPQQQLLSQLLTPSTKQQNTNVVKGTITNLLTQGLPKTHAKTTSSTKKKARLGPTVWNSPPPIYKPMAAPGVHLRTAPNAGSINSLQHDDMNGNPNSNVFYFPYNPAEIDIASDVDSIQTAKIVLQPASSTGRNIGDVVGSFGIKFLIDRSIEVRRRTLSHNLGPGNTKEFEKMGTNYDLEFFFRVFNGSPRHNSAYRAPLANSSMYGFLAPLQVRVVLSGTLTFHGRPTSVSINHMLLTHAMVPIVTEVTVQFTNVLGAADRAVGVNASPAGSTTAASSTLAGNLNPNVNG